jgi:hypothetical protein
MSLLYDAAVAVAVIVSRCGLDGKLIYWALETSGVRFMLLCK